MPYPRRQQLPERYLNPRLYDAYKASPRSSLELSLVAGFPHHSHFSYVINATRIKDSPIVRQRLERLADALGFPRDQIYLPETVAPEVLR
jgi:hypothetical protein